MDSGKDTLPFTQLLTYMDSVLTMLGEGHQVDVIYLDFSKAFGKVDHCILMKLDSYE